MGVGSVVVVNTFLVIDVSKVVGEVVVVVWKVVLNLVGEANVVVICDRNFEVSVVDSAAGAPAVIVVISITFSVSI